MNRLLAVLAFAACNPPLPDDPYTAGRWADSITADFKLESSSMLDIVTEHMDAAHSYRESGLDARGRTFHRVDSTTAKLDQCFIDIGWQQQQVKHAVDMRLALDKQNIGLQRFRTQFAEWHQGWQDHISCWREVWDNPDFADHRDLIKAQQDSIQADRRALAEERAEANRRHRERQAEARRVRQRQEAEQRVAARRRQAAQVVIGRENLRAMNRLTNRCNIEAEKLPTSERAQYRLGCLDAARAWYREARDQARLGLRHPPPETWPPR